MASFVKLQPFVEAVAEGVHDLGADSLVLALTNSAPLATDGQLSQITEISYTNLSSRALAVASSSQTGGLYKLVINDIVLTSSGGATGPFRYVVIYNSSTAGPANALIGYYDYGSPLTLADGDTLTVNFDGTNGVLTLT